MAGNDKKDDVILNQRPGSYIRKNSDHGRHDFNVTLDNWASILSETKDIDVDVVPGDYGAETYILRNGIPKSGAFPPRIPAKRQRLSGYDEPIYVATYVPYGHFGASISAGYYSTDPNEVAFAVGAPWESEDSSRPGEGNVYVIPNSFISQNMATAESKMPPSYSRSLGISSSGRSDQPSSDQRFGTASTSLRTLGRTYLAVSAPKDRL